MASFSLLLVLVASALPGQIHAQVSSADKQVILDVHNQCRSIVDPTAENMVLMTWNDDLARAAQDHADLCSHEHDTNDDREEAVGLKINVGQNLAMSTDGYLTWTTAIENWDSESDNLNFGTSRTGVIGHYTQVAQHWASHVGCGFAECPDQYYSDYYVCNYAYGQYSSNELSPYTSGTPCAACPDLTCTDNMCDCGTEAVPICRNGGTFNIADCSCSCTELYSGTECETSNCPDEDPSHCGGAWPESYCDLYTNVPTTCPYMCHLCT